MILFYLVLNLLMNIYIHVYRYIQCYVRQDLAVSINIMLKPFSNDFALLLKIFINIYVYANEIIFIKGTCIGGRFNQILSLML